jgi:hypothetical protein
LFAIAANAQINFGIQAGALLSKLTAKSGSVSYNTKYAPGFKAGVFSEISLGSGLYFTPELNYTSKGGKVKDTTGQSITEIYNYIELPLNVMYRVNAGSGNVLLGLGPVLSYAVSAKEKYGNISVDIPVGNNWGELKPFEFGANVFAGYELSNGLRCNIQLRPNFNSIITDINVPDMTLKNLYFGLTIGYRLRSHSR